MNNKLLYNLAFSCDSEAGLSTHESFFRQQSKILSRK